MVLFRTIDAILFVTSVTRCKRSIVLSSMTPTTFSTKYEDNSNASAKTLASYVSS